MDRMLFGVVVIYFTIIITTVDFTRPFVHVKSTHALLTRLITMISFQDQWWWSECLLPPSLSLPPPPPSPSPLPPWKPAMLSVIYTPSQPSLENTNPLCPFLQCHISPPPSPSSPLPPRIPAMQQTGEQFANVLVRGTSAPDRSKVNLAALQKDLSIEMNGDFYVVLAFVEMKTDVL